MPAQNPIWLEPAAQARAMSTVLSLNRRQNDSKHRILRRCALCHCIMDDANGFVSVSVKESLFEPDDEWFHLHGAISFKSFRADRQLVCKIRGFSRQNIGLVRLARHSGMMFGEHFGRTPPPGADNNDSTFSGGSGNSHGGSVDSRPRS